MTRVALLSNPRSTGNRAILPQVRSFCAAHQDIFHYEVERFDQISAALKTIAQVKPKVLVLNGGDGTVQAALTEIYHGGHFGEALPPVAVLPNGKTNLIASDLGAAGDPLAALARVLELTRADLDPHIVERELIALSGGSSGKRPVLGMFLGGAGLAETMLYCRHKLYPWLPNGVAHFLAFLLGTLGVLLGRRTARFLPPRPIELKVSVKKREPRQGAFAVLMVTTLQQLLLGNTFNSEAGKTGAMQLVLIERSPRAVFGAFFATLMGRLGRSRVRGVHVEMGSEIEIGGERSSVLLDGELFETSPGMPILLKPTRPMSFLKLAA